MEQGEAESKSVAEPSSLYKIAAHSRQEIYPASQQSSKLECVPPLRVGKIFLFFFLFKEQSMESE